MFPDSYVDSRERFWDDLSLVQASWPNAALNQFKIDVEDDLSIDWIQAEATANRQKLLILTTGQHGAEGIVGSAMMQVFIQEYLPKMNPQDTGLLLVHAINPWGMKHMRRVNANNVDLNRNFVWEEADLNAAANPNYESISRFLNPESLFSRYMIEKLKFIYQLMRMLISPGQAVLRSAMLMGQYRTEQGLYFGGQGFQAETVFMMDLYRVAIQKYEQIVHLDMHTGYGPRHQMSLVNSPLEQRAPQSLAHAFGYPLIVSATPDEFYLIHGDMVDWVYRLRQEEFPAKKLYSTAFEFGTLGDSLLGSLRSMRAMVFENQAHWYGVWRPHVERRVQNEFAALFSTHERDWREKALCEARQAFTGILTAKEFVDGST